VNRVQMGRVIAHLQRHRRIDTSAKLKPRSDERELAKFLNDSSVDDRADIEGVFQGMGFDLVHFDSFKTNGLAPDANVFLLVRRHDGPNELFSERLIDERMQVRNDTVTARRIWFTQFWFVLLYLFYTRRSRVSSEISRYVETTFNRADLVQAMHEYINDMVRKLGKDTLSDDAVYSCLVSESGVLVDQYAGRFIDLMVDGQLLDRLGDDRYRQSLLSAVEIKNNCMQGLEPWLQTAGEPPKGPLEAGRELLIRPVEPGDGMEH
jgi:hypothetical protein